MERKPDGVADRTAYLPKQPPALLRLIRRKIPYRIRSHQRRCSQDRALPTACRCPYLIAIPAIAFKPKLAPVGSHHGLVPA